MKALHTKAIYDTFEDANHTPAITADTRVIDSWKRCVDRYGLEPDGTGSPNVITSSELQQIRYSYEDLIAAATPEIEKLFSYLSDDQYLVTLTARNGVMLDFMASPSMEKTCKEFNFSPGSIWTEELQGTNGIGTCLETQTSLTVLGEEHFSTRYVGLTCTVAPIFDNDSSLHAALNVTTPCETNHQTQELVRKIVELSAKRIQHNLFRKTYRESIILRLSHLSGFSDVTAEGLVAVDGDGIVVASENCGWKESDLNNFNIAAGQNITEVLGRTFDQMQVERLHESVLHVKQGKELSGNLFVKIYCPSSFKMPGGRDASYPLAVRSAKIPEEVTGELRRICGNDAKMIRNMEIALRVVNLGLPLLLLGETGTGKGVFANAIHNAGARKDKPFVAVNCSAIPENLIESELFGYRPGAFTGADARGYKGRILEANGGTLFLDEIGDMPTSLQTRLLRVLSEGEIIPLGSSKKVQLDLNIISATLQNLPKFVSDGTFREDLYFRLNGASLQLPPLRERTDIKDIISGILEEECEVHNMEVRISDNLLSYLEGYFWQGNIRELKNALRYCIAMSDGEILDKRHLPIHMQVTNNGKTGLDTAVTEEKEITLLALRQENWNVSAAARMLGVSRATLHRRMKQHGLARSTH